jgi:two-component system NtrC family sensor kinase
MENPDLPDTARKDLRVILQEAQRTKQIVQNLLSFARQMPPQRSAVQLNAILRRTVQLRSYDFNSHGIEVIEHLDEQLPEVMGDAHQLQQVFLNILNNAHDAVHEVGRPARIEIMSTKAGEAVEVSFRDNGNGISHPDKIFDPFFTTKEVGKGTGLGLSICYGIIQEHGGQIRAENGTNGGGVIEVVLPSAGESAAPEKVVPSRREAALAGRVLLIENEEAVLEFERDVLTGAGAEVVTSMNVEEMKSLLQKQSFDAIIIDGKAQGHGSAREVYGWLAENSAGMEKHLLFTFSSVAEPEVRSFLQEKGVSCLVKPFEVADLIAHARRLMQKAHAASAS